MIRPAASEMLGFLKLLRRRSRSGTELSGVYVASNKLVKSLMLLGRAISSQPLITIMSHAQRLYHQETRGAVYLRAWPEWSR
jgi:hypothetical protein